MTDLEVPPEPVVSTAPRPSEPSAVLGQEARLGSSLSYMPGLDGLRAVAVVAVFLFHGGVATATGGYLAVSTFFTLSGFLITLLLLREQESLGRLSLGAFWARRIRRLLPAASLGVALAALVTTSVGTASQRQAFGAEGVATFFDIANWRFVVADTSYGQLFETPSALQHAWSLAVEAQFYWIYPLLFVGLMRLVGGDRRRFGFVLGALFVGSIAVARLGGFSADRIYYGTDTRAAELLAGAILGVVVSQRFVTPTSSEGSDTNARFSALSALSGMAFVLLVGAWIVTPQDVDWIGTGGLAAYSMVSCLVILGTAQRGTMLASVLSLSPLRALGRISYGFYLFHWPILLLLTPDRMPGPTLVRLVVAGAVTSALAVLSYRYIEAPIRTRSTPFDRVGLGAVVGLCGVVALLPSFLVMRAAPSVDPTDALAPGALVTNTDSLGAPDQREVVAVAPDSTEPEPATLTALQPAPFEIPSRPLRIVVVGDSVAHRLAPLLDAWGQGNGVWSAASHARFGCGLVRGGLAHGVFGDNEFGPECSAWPEEWAQMLAEVQPDVVVLAGGFWDAIDRRFEEGGPWIAPGDPEYDQLVLDEYTLALEVLTSTGTPLVWLDHPPVAESGTEASVIEMVGYDDARMQRLDEIQAEVAASFPAARIVRTMDFLTVWPGGVLDKSLRPDGVHFQGDTVGPFINWLGPEIMNVYWSVSVPSGVGSVPAPQPPAPPAPAE